MSQDYQHLTRDCKMSTLSLKKRGDSATQVSKQLGLHRPITYWQLKRNSAKPRIPISASESKSLRETK